MFEVDDYVVYGNNGVCRIVEITTMDLRGVSSDKLYYRLSPVENASSRVFVPVDNEKIVMRRMLTKEEALALIEKVPSIEPVVVCEDKFREDVYKEAVNSLEPEKWFQVIKTLYLRKKERLAQGKKNTSMDERYQKVLENFIHGELSVVLNIPKSEIKSIIGEKLE